MEKKQEERNDSSLEKSQQSLIIEVDELTEEIKKQNSRPRIFWDGIVKGFGYAVGATMLFSLLVAITGFIVKHTDIPLLERLVQWLGLGVS